MQHLEGSGTPVLYIGRTVLKCQGNAWAVYDLPQTRVAGVKLYIRAKIARIPESAQTVTKKYLKSRQHALNKLTQGPSSLLV